MQCDWRTISEGYFDATRTPILAGRAVPPRDDANASKVVIVDLGVGGGEPAKVIGVVRDARVHTPAEPARPAYYVSAYRSVWGPMTLVVRTTASPDALLPMVREEVRALDPSLPVFGIRTMEDAVSRQLAPQRLDAALLGGFAALALALAVAGTVGPGDPLTFAVTIAVLTVAALTAC